MDEWRITLSAILTTGPSLPVAVEIQTAPISIQIQNFLSLCPPPQISTVEAMTPQLTLGTRISGGHRPEIKKNGFQNAYFFRSYFPIQNTCNWVSHSAIAYAYGSKMWRASSPIVSRNVRKHRACIKQRNLQWRCAWRLTNHSARIVLPVLQNCFWLANLQGRKSLSCIDFFLHKFKQNALHISVENCFTHRIPSYFLDTCTKKTSKRVKTIVIKLKIKLKKDEVFHYFLN